MKKPIDGENCTKAELQSAPRGVVLHCYTVKSNSRTEIQIVADQWSLMGSDGRDCALGVFQPWVVGKISVKGS